MENKKTVYAGYVLLGIILLAGVMVIRDTRMTINAQVAEAEEAAKPAEIELTIITPTDCKQCTDVSTFLEEIQKQNVRVLDSKTVAADSKDGLALIETYGITRVPTILINGEYDKQNVQEAFSSLAGVERDKTLVIQVQQPVYVDLTSGETVGLVDVTYLTDSNCPDCYNPAQHKIILERNFGLTIRTEQEIDVRSAEGRALASQYTITQVPTALLSSQALAYDRLMQSWEQVGSIEEDGVFVFRNNTVLGDVVYKNLETGETVQPKTSDK